MKRSLPPSVTPSWPHTAAGGDGEEAATLKLRACAESVAARVRAALRRAPLAVEAASAGRFEELVDFSCFAEVSMAERRELLVAASAVPGADRAAGALVGLAVGDALGAPFEFMATVDEPGASGALVEIASLAAVGTELGAEVTRGKALKEGQWTDDTSMALCLADSLLLGRYDGSDVRVRFWCWWELGYNNTFRNDRARDHRRSVGLGGNVGKSLAAVRDSNPPSRYDVPSEDSGNGSIMRLAPVPIAFSSDVKQAMAVSAESSRTTHPGRCAAAACRFLGFLICRAMSHTDGQSVRQFLDDCAEEYLEKHSRLEEVDLRRLVLGKEPEGSKERCWNWRAPRLDVEASLAARRREGGYNGYTVSDDYFGSYCMDALAVSLHCLYFSTCFAEAVVRCVNFLGDADSTAAVCGQVAGAFYGLAGIDARLRARLERWDDSEVACKAVLLWTLGASSEPIEEPRAPAAPTPGVVRTREIVQIMDMGFSAAEADAALKMAEGSVEQAIMLLIGA